MQCPANGRAGNRRFNAPHRSAPTYLRIVVLTLSKAEGEGSAVAVPRHNASLPHPVELSSWAQRRICFGRLGGANAPLPRLRARLQPCRKRSQRKGASAPGVRLEIPRACKVCGLTRLTRTPR